MSSRRPATARCQSGRGRPVPAPAAAGPGGINRPAGAARSAGAGTGLDPADASGARPVRVTGPAAADRGAASPPRSIGVWNHHSASDDRPVPIAHPARPRSRPGPRRAGGRSRRAGRRPTADRVPSVGSRPFAVRVVVRGTGRSRRGETTGVSDPIPWLARDPTRAAFFARIATSPIRSA
jgi:hypothetical protein